MKNMLTPVGVSDFTPEEALHYHELIHNLETIFSEMGYTPVRTGSVEYYDTLAHALPETLQQQCLKFFDATGRTLVLRPDHTTAIARLVASRMQSHPLPLKLYYAAPIFRSPLSTEVTYLEHMQAGLEYIGSTNPDSDAEILQCCAKALAACGLENIGFELGHRDFANQYSEKEKNAIVTGNFATAGFLPKLTDASDLSENNPLYPILNTLPQTLRNNSMINPTLVQGVENYTGLIFRCYVPGLRFPVASGGRYDTLLAKFGYPQPAVGFALDLDVIQQGQLL